MTVVFTETAEEPTVRDWEAGWAVLSWGDLIDTGFETWGRALDSALEYADQPDASTHDLTVALVERCPIECPGFITAYDNETIDCPYCDHATGWTVTQETKVTP